MKDTIVFLESSQSGSSREAIRAASRLGYLTLLITNRKKLIEKREEFPDVTEMILMKNITEQGVHAEINQLQKEYNIVGIMSFIDPYVSISARLMNELCGSKISVRALEIMEDKTLTRHNLLGNPHNPQFQILQSDKDSIDNQFKYPFIIKPALTKASRHTYLVLDSTECRQTIQRIEKLFPKQPIVVEEYLEGPQYVVETLVKNGEAMIIAVFKQEITKNIKFIVTGYELQLHYDESLHIAVESIMKDLEVDNAACHLELRLVKGDWKLVEMNPRISGGAMNRMIENAFGINLMEESVNLYLGINPNISRKFEKNLYSHYITINSVGYLVKVTGRNKAISQPGILEVFIKPRIGTMLTPPISMGNRYGHVMATGENAIEAKENAVNAAKYIRFYIEPI